ncbi:MAG TPA: hypothetical protein VFB28_12030 [Terriglobales bacterium]|nr:hypothetical protein [Terriglobales bacterium]
MYPWPLGVDETLLDESLKIAMYYLAMTGQAEPYADVQRRVAVTIVEAWRQGAEHPIRLANYGIGAIEHKEERDRAKIIEIKTRS